MRIGKLIAICAVALIVLFTVLSSFYLVSEQQNAVVTQFGKILRTDTAGLHFKVPFVQHVKMVDVTTHGTGIGYITAGGKDIVNQAEGIMITKDFNLVDIDFYMEYRVSDPVAYLYNARDPESMLRNIALSSIRSTVVNYTVDEAMTTGKGAIQADIKAKIIDELAEQDIGLQIVNITVQDAEPPTDEIVHAFKAVENAKQDADTEVNLANKYANEQLPAAKAKADQITQSADAQKAARIAEAEGQVARFNAMYEEYKQNPDITRQRMYYEAIEDILPDAKIIVTDGTTQTILPVESFVNMKGDLQ